MSGGTMLTIWLALIAATFFAGFRVVFPATGFVTFFRATFPATGFVTFLGAAFPTTGFVAFLRAAFPAAGFVAFLRAAFFDGIPPAAAFRAEPFAFEAFRSVLLRAVVFFLTAISDLPPPGSPLRLPAGRLRERRDRALRRSPR